MSIKLSILLIVLMFAFSVNKYSIAMTCGGKEKDVHQQIAQAGGTTGAAQADVVKTVKKTENVNNKICPVSGEEINEKEKAVYEYDGKVYNFCCPMCIGTFKKDPQKYIKKIEEETQAVKEKAAKGPNLKQEVGVSSEIEKSHQH